jgi:hypothetical protein
MAHTWKLNARPYSDNFLAGLHWGRINERCMRFAA